MTIDSVKSSAVPSPSPRSPRRWRWLWIGIPVVLFLLVAAIPSVIGSRWVYQKLVDRLAIQGFRLEIESAQVRWLSPLAFRGIRLEQIDAPKPDDDAKPDRRLDLLSIESVHSDRSLLGYLLGGRDLGRITIDKPKIDIELLDDTSNLERLAKSLQSDPRVAGGSPAKAPPKIDLAVSIRDLSVSVVPADRDRSLLVVPEFSVDLEYRSLDGRDRLEIAPAKILDQVEITQELVRIGLGRAVPFLAKSAWFDGRVSLETQAIEILLNEPLASSGQATLTLHEVRSGPSEPLLMNVVDMISKFRGKEPSYELVFIDGSQIEVGVRDGNISHSGVQVGFPKIDPRLQMTSAGRVGLADKSLDLQVGVPVPLEQLARRESVQELGVPELFLPIRGTLDAPVIDWKSIRHESSDLLSLISVALGEDAPGTAAAIDALGAVAGGQADEAIGAAVDVLKELRRMRSERRTGAETKAAEPPATEESEPPPARRPLRDALKNIIRGN